MVYFPKSYKTAIIRFMNCPNCQSPLVLKTIKSTGLTYKYHFCEHCGGIWIDSFTVNNLPWKLIKKIDNFTTSQKTNNLINGVCPECHLPLKRLEAESIPPSLEIYSCTNCFKRWFPKGNLIKFKQAQDTKLKYLKTWQVPIKSVFTVLLPAIVIIPLALFVFKPNKPQIYFQENQPEHIISYPQLFWSLNNQVTISFSTNIEATTLIEYGGDKTNLVKEMINTKPQKEHQITILIGKGVIYYRLTAKNTKVETTPFYTIYQQQNN